MYKIRVEADHIYNLLLNLVKELVFNSQGKDFIEVYQFSTGNH